ncbi:alpha/beta fold hydrolase [Pseudoduganella violaceinigra]|uniref:alpha/beta fold hydrolase n=1 Tax=Pseudoduganella violaceinigra TaxID=246602 RepID=UPI0003F8711D|nr:alpha/beta hydrolase [Pseudoduganella violaceinigra]
MTIKRLLFLVLLLVAGGATAWGVMAVRQAEARQTGKREALAPKGGEYVDAGDARIFMQRSGSPDAPAVVFLHGTGSWSETWRASMATANQAGYQAIALDMPPFGYSIPPASGEYDKQRQAARLRAALDNAGIRRAVFVAHSFGAAPLMEALLSNADDGRVQALVLVDAALGLDEAQSDGSDSVIQSLLRWRWVSQPIAAGFLTKPEATEKLLKSFVSEKEKITPAWLRLYQQPLALEGSYREVAAWLPELLARRGHEASDMPDAYGRINWPVTLVWGETDTITPLAQAENLQRLVPGAKLVRIPRAGHIPQIEEPELFQEALARVLQEARPRR